MDRTKSIDGLKPRRQISSEPQRPVQSTAPVLKPASKSASKPVAKPLAKPVKTKVVKPTKPATIPEPTPVAEPSVSASEDFLKPIQAFDFDEDTKSLQASTAPVKPVEHDDDDENEDDPIPAKLTRKEKRAKKREEKKAKKEAKKADKKKPSKIRRIITWTLLIIVLLLIGGVTWLILWGNDIIAKITGGQGTVFDLITFIEPTYEPLKTDENGRTNILAFGTSGYDMSGDEGSGIHAGAQLTDSIMAISLDQETGDVAMLSLPRDLKASPTCTATGKINEVYWCNNIDGTDEQSGAEALMAEVSDILGLDFQYYAHLNWGSLVQIVDILDGITITLDEGIYDYYWTGAVYEPDTPYTLNGEEALGLARARHGTTGGDFSRGASQQKILVGIKDKILEKDLSITDLVNLASTLGDNLRTNFNVEELKTMAHYASDLDLSSMRQISLISPHYYMTTGNINGISYVLPSAGVGNYTSIQEYVSKMTSSDPRVYEDYAILVLNATETYGLASSEQAELEEAGFTNIDVDDAPESEYKEERVLYALTDSAPGTKKLLEKHFDLTAKSAEELSIEVPEGYDFVIILSEPSNNSEQ